jgi:DNA-binding PadR family transcriptional regulator
MKHPILLSPLQLMSLAVLARCPFHPYAIRMEIIEFTLHRSATIPKTSVYSTLSILKKLGYIEDTWESNYWLIRRVGTPYELTQDGRQRLEKELDIYRKVIQDTDHWLSINI